MLTHMLDTDTVSFWFRGHQSVRRNLNRISALQLCISSITLAELRVGPFRRNSLKINASINTFVSKIQVTPFDRAAAERFAEIGNVLLSQGTPIGEFDTLIAAQALSLNLILVTNNIRHFSRVRGLRIENWVEDE